MQAYTEIPACVNTCMQFLYNSSSATHVAALLE